MYTVKRFYNLRSPITIKTGLTLEQAQAHCRDPETSSQTATNHHAVKRTREMGSWFDGYDLTTRKGA